MNNARDRRFLVTQFLYIYLSPHNFSFYLKTFSSYISVQNLHCPHPSLQGTWLCSQGKSFMWLAESLSTHLNSAVFSENSVCKQNCWLLLSVNLRSLSADLFTATGSEWSKMVNNPFRETVWRPDCLTVVSSLWNSEIVNKSDSLTVYKTDCLTVMSIQDSWKVTSSFCFRAVHKWCHLF